MLKIGGSPSVQIGVSHPHRRRMALVQLASPDGATMVSVDVLPIHLRFLIKVKQKGVIDHSRLVLLLQRPCRAEGVGEGSRSVEILPISTGFVLVSFVEVSASWRE
jgi:hypothetical protein